MGRFPKRIRYPQIVTDSSQYHGDSWYNNRINPIIILIYIARPVCRFATTGDG